MVAGTLCRPAGEVRVRREPAHVGPELADQHLRSPFLDPVQRAQQPDRRLKRGALGLRRARGRELRLDPQFDRGKPLLLEPRAFGADERDVAQVGQHGTSPQAERLIEDRNRACGIA